jgi:tetratricopeptide (TPR) repeat protein
MRKIWFALLATAGIAAANSNAATPTAPMNSAPHGIAPSQPTWTQRITAPFKSNPFAALKKKSSQSAPKIEPADKPFDPAKATPELYVGLAQMSQRAGNIPQARELYQKALAKTPKHREALLGAARMEDREGQLDVALMLYQRTADAHPQDATVLNDLALCHARRGELPHAHQVLEQTIRLEPKNALYRNNVAKVLVELNAINPAMQHLTAVHQPAVAHYNMAVLLAERGRQEEANYFLSQALTIDPQMAQAHTMLAQQSEPAGLAAPAAGPSPVMQPMTGPMLAQSAAQSVAPAVEAADSILPTPEVVATVPWGPMLTGPTAYPTSDMSAATPAPMPVIATPKPQMPALLPPVR